MITLEEYKDKQTKNEVRECIHEDTCWDYITDKAICEIKRIQTQYPNDIIRMELETKVYEYSDDDYSCISFYITRKETDKEYNERIDNEYKYYIENEKRDLETYERIKKELDKK